MRNVIYFDALAARASSAAYGRKTTVRVTSRLEGCAVLPRNCGAGVGKVLRPTAIEFGALLWSEFQPGIALPVGQALPKRHRKLGAPAHRQLITLAHGFQESGPRHYRAGTAACSAGGGPL